MLFIVVLEENKRREGGGGLWGEREDKCQMTLKTRTILKLLQQHIDILQQHCYYPDMRQLTFRELQTSTQWVKDLPLEVTRYGKVIMVLGNVTATQRQLEVNKVYIKDLEAQLQAKGNLRNLDNRNIVTATSPSRPNLDHLRKIINDIENKKVTDNWE
jgi:hypothetical protein